MKKFLILAVMCVAMSCNSGARRGNPFFYEWDTPFGVPPFDLIRSEHFQPAFREAMKFHLADIDSITSNPKPATFDNTILALDRSGAMYSRVAHIFFALVEAETDERLERIKARVSPEITAHDDAIAMDSTLFARIKTVYDSRFDTSFNDTKRRLTELTYQHFVRGGALLSAADKTELKQVNEALSTLGVAFTKNRLDAAGAYKLVINESEGYGLPQNVISQARTLAETLKEGAKNDDEKALYDGKLVFTLSKTSWIPFLTNSDKDDYRRQIYQAWLDQCADSTAFDNTQIINDIVRLRVRKAQLLGFDTWADFVLDDQMARSPERVYPLLDSIWAPALELAKTERDRLRELKRTEKGDSLASLNSWDWWFYAEKVRKADYDLDEEQLKPYFSLDNVRSGIFKLCNRLYGITFRPITVPVYHKDVVAYEVLDIDNSHLGIIYMDFFPRAGKGAGAWCGQYRPQGYTAEGERISPITYIVANFTEPVGEDTPALLTLDDASTFFHEFGHAVHNLFSDVPYNGLQETERDFVELPSQIMENWAFTPELLREYAVHYRTGNAIPSALIDKITGSALFNQGFSTVEQLAASYSDMDIHDIKEYAPMDISDFERQSLTVRRGLIPEIEPRYRYPYFSHIFNDGFSYSAGYYSYIWSEVLDKDAFEAFVESGDVFNRRIANDFRHKVLAPRGSKPGAELYRDFRGTAEPSPVPLFKARGLRTYAAPYCEPPMVESPPDSVLRIILGEGPLVE